MSAPAPALAVREAEPEEWAAAGALCVAAYRADQLASERYEQTLRDVRARANGAHVLVAAAGDQLLGTVTWIPDGGPYGEIARPDEAEFRMLATSPAARGRGVGEALTRACLARGRALGRARVVCSSGPSMLAAHRLYARLGFTRNPGRAWSPVPGLELEVFERWLSVSMPA